MGFIEVLVPVLAVAGVASVATTVSRVMRHVLNMHWVMRLVVMSVRDDFICSFGLFTLQAVGDEEDGSQNEGNLSGGEGFEGDELDDEEFAEEELGTKETDDTAYTTCLLFATT